MRKIAFLSLLLILSSIVCYGFSSESISSYLASKPGSVVSGSEICEGRSFTTVYTIRGNEICEGRGFRTVYTIR